MSIGRNTTFNLLGSIIPLVVSLFTIPIYLGLIGDDRYGVLAIAWLLLGYFGVFDLGLGRATAHRIATLRSATTKERAQTFWTALTLNLGIGVAGGLLIWPIATYFFGSVFKIEDTLRPEVQSAVPWLVLAVPIATLSGVLSGALQGRERFLELNIISVSGTLLFQLLPLATVMLYGADLKVLLPAAIFARLLTLLLLLRCCRCHVFHGHAATFNHAQAGHLLGFGGWVTVTTFVGPMMVILDRFIIGAIAGAKAITFYTVPFQLGERTEIVSGSLSSALFPRFSTSSPEECQDLANEGMRALAVVMTPLVVLGIMLMDPFLSWWIEPTFANQSTLVGQVILLGFWANAFAKIPYAKLQASGRPDIVAKIHLSEVLPYFGLLYLGLDNFGLVGAAVAFSLRVALDLVLLARFAGMMHLLLPILLVPTLFLAGAFFISTQSINSQSEWFTVVAIHLLLMTIWAWRVAPKSLCDFMILRLKPLIRFFGKKQCTNE